MDTWSVFIKLLEIKDLDLADNYYWNRTIGKPTPCQEARIRILLASLGRNASDYL